MTHIHTHTPPPHHTHTITHMFVCLCNISRGKYKKQQWLLLGKAGISGKGDSSFPIYPFVLMPFYTVWKFYLLLQYSFKAVD